MDIMMTSNENIISALNNHVSLAFTKSIDDIKRTGIDIRKPRSKSLMTQKIRVTLFMKVFLVTYDPKDVAKGFHM